jgi:diguanylate cyclase (GGDEF)-like protein
MRLGIANFILLLGVLAALPLCVLLYVSYGWQVTQLRADARVAQEREARAEAREFHWRLQALASGARFVQELSAPGTGAVAGSAEERRPLPNAAAPDVPDRFPVPAPGSTPGADRLHLSPFVLERGAQVAYLSFAPTPGLPTPGPRRVTLRELLADRPADAPTVYLVDENGASVSSALPDQSGLPDRLAGLARQGASSEDWALPGLAAVAPIGAGWSVAIPRDSAALAAQESSLRQRFLLGGFLAVAIGLALVHAVALRLRGAMDEVMSDFGDEEGSRPDSVITELAEIGGALATARARFGQTASELERARHDALTGLPGRDLFMRQATAQITAARAMEGYAVAILYVDLDGFKAVNDTQGHRAGDEILRGVAATLRQNVRAPDSVGRMGGDEFVVCVSAPRRHLMDIAMRARDGISKGIAALGPGVGCSIGWASASCERNLSDLIAEADGSMYVAKQARRHEGRTAARSTASGT